MNRYALAASLAALVMLPATAMAAGNPDKGMALAREVCSACHAVPPYENSINPVSAAPDFKAIANMKGMNATGLHAFLTTPHPTMPNLVLKPRQLSDVIAYILSIRDI